MAECGRPDDQCPCSLMDTADCPMEGPSATPILPFDDRQIVSDDEE
jgi:hypothetical protein